MVLEVGIFLRKTILMPLVAISTMGWRDPFFGAIGKKGSAKWGKTFSFCCLDYNLITKSV